MLMAVSLLACPFCREMSARGEHGERGEGGERGERGERERCPDCGVALVPLEKLPPSADALHDDLPVEPDCEVLPRAYLGRGRGLLAGFALVGLVAFFLPWVDMTMPEIMSLSGFVLAQRLGWAWGSGVAWFILVPTVLSRRTIRQMRGARVAAAFLAAVPGTTVGILLARPPHGAHGMTLHFTFGPALYVTLALSLLGFVVALLFGGRSDDIRLRRGSSAGQLVH
jgi:hypothetical protein